MFHPTAVISKKAKIHSSVEIGPFCIIDDNVNISEGNKLISNVHITGNTTIGLNNTFYPFTSIGHIPQDLKYKGEKSFLSIGDNNTFRENVTVNPGTEGGGLKTVIKKNNLFMVGTHIAHDCIINSNIVMANNATLAGHVEIYDNAILGGNCGVHQFVKIGKFAMIGGMSGVGKNIIPYGLYTGIRENLKGINLIGLKRKGLDTIKINKIDKAIKEIFNESNSIEKNIAKLNKEYLEISEIGEIIEFINKFQKRGICKYIDD